MCHGQFTFMYTDLLKLFCFLITLKTLFHRIMVNYIHAVFYRDDYIIFYKYIGLFLITICYLSVEPCWYLGHVYDLIFPIFGILLILCLYTRYLYRIMINICLSIDFLTFPSYMDSRLSMGLHTGNMST